ncbi:MULTISPECIES: PH domain-containing protein [unclassified Flavobacterium]|uniref:PH domain-containing protein n=1 Tax=unclassified Flavobacterium TaxID=196869 RepID=UPI003F923935
MENFSNATIDITQLPKFEEVQFSVLDTNYWKVILFNITILFVILGVGLGLVLYYNAGLNVFMFPLWTAFLVLLTLVLTLSRLGYKKKGFAFREHDVLFRHGIIATNTIVIPYNRVQHVALHEGFIARYFKLAKIEIFTAGGSSSDLKIPGIAIDQAESIKQLLMVKIQKQL